MPSRTTLTINGQPHDLAIEPRVTLLDLLREQLHLMVLRRAATMASAARARCWRTGIASWRACPWRSPRTGNKSRRSRGWRRAKNCIQCRPLLSSTTDSSAAFVHLGRFVRRSRPTMRRRIVNLCDALHQVAHARQCVTCAAGLRPMMGSPPVRPSAKCMDRTADWLRGTGRAG